LEAFAGLSLLGMTWHDIAGRKMNCMKVWRIRVNIQGPKIDKIGCDDVEDEDGGMVTRKARNNYRY
jgi:hypothetical protein